MELIGFALLPLFFLSTGAEMISFPSQQNYPSATPAATPSRASADNPAETSQRNTSAETENAPARTYPPGVENSQRQTTKQISHAALRDSRRQRNKSSDKFDNAYVNKATKKINASYAALQREVRDGMTAIPPKQTAARRLKSGIYLAGGAASAVGATVAAGTVALVSAPFFALQGVFIGAAVGAVGAYQGTSEALKRAPKPINIIASTGSAILGGSMLAVILPLANIVDRGLSRGSPMSKTFNAINKLPRAMERAAFKKLSTRDIGQMAFEAMVVNSDEIDKKRRDYVAEYGPGFQQTTATIVNMY